MPSQNENRGSSERDLSFAWFTCGLMTGVAITLLFAPVQGRDARRWVAQVGGDTRRKTAALLERNRQAMQVIRRRGILGLGRRHSDESDATAGQREAAPVDSFTAS